MDSSHGTRPRRSQSVRRRTIDDTLTGHGSRSEKEMDNKAEYPCAGSNVSSCRYQLLAIDLPDRMIWQKDCIFVIYAIPALQNGF